MNRKARANVTFKVNLKYPDRNTFAQRFSQNISRTGIFVRAQDPLPVGSRVNFDYRLSDDSQVMRGSGIVRWIRTPEQAKEPNDPPGMGIEFVDLDPPTEMLIAQIVARFGEGPRAPKRAATPAAPRVTTPAPASPARPSDIPLDTEEEFALDSLDAPPSAMLSAAVDLARAVAGEATQMDFSDLPARGASATVAWCACDLAGSSITWHDSQGSHTTATPLPGLPHWLGLTWPAPLARAMARRLRLALARGANSAVNALVGDAFVPLEELAQTALRDALAESATDHQGISVVVPNGMTTKAEAQLAEMLQRVGFSEVNLVGNGETLCKAADVRLERNDLALCVRLGTVAGSITLVEAGGFLRPAIWAPDVGLRESDELLADLAEVELGRHGADLRGDPMTRRDLVAQIANLRRNHQEDVWDLTGAGVAVQLDGTSRGEKLAPLCERLVLLCDTMRQNHVPQGRQVKYLVFASDEPPWAGLLAELQAQLGIEPICIADGASSLVSAAWRSIQPTQRDM